MPDSYTDAVEAAVAGIVADMRREYRAKMAEMDGAIALFRARAGEAEARYALFERTAEARIAERLAEVKDGLDGAPGRDVDPETVEVLRGQIAEVRAAIPVIPAAPDLSGFATRAEVAEAVAAIPSVDLTPLATIEALAEVRSAIPAMPEAPDLTGLATVEALREVADAIAAIPAPEMPDLSGLATKAEVEALRAEIPVLPEPQDLSGLATKAEMVEAVAGVPAPDLSGFATKADVAAIPAPEMPDLSGLATKAEVEALRAEIPVLPEVIHGRDADPAEIARMVSEAVAAIPAPKDGKDGLDGKDADPEVIRSMIAEAMPNRDELRGAPGRLPVVKAWAEGVHYEADVVSHRGATWQATKDTGREPPHSDWICLATAGADARGFVHAGTFAEDGEYRANDVVMLNGSTFLALRDAPGPCPGDGWQLWASRGSKGPAGDRGLKGDKGDPGRDAAEVVGFYRDGEVVTMTFADGREMRA